MRRAGGSWMRAALACSMLGQAACGLNMAEHYERLRPSLVAHDHRRALAYVDGGKDSFYGSKNELLYLMDRAMVQFDGGDDIGCRATLERAKLVAHKLHKRSVGAEAEAWLTTDNALPYQGEDFEKTFLHVLAACSYLRTGDTGEARVEARQVTTLLNALLEARTEADRDGQVYRDDALAHWLSGMLYEADAGDLAHLSDARIEYTRALALYEQVDAPTYGTPVPPSLVLALARTLRGLGADGTGPLTKLRARYPQLVPHAHALAPHTGRVVVLLLAGEAPIKMQQAWEAVLMPNVYRVAYPVFVRRAQPRTVPSLTLAATGEPVGLQLGMDVEAVAVRNLADHMGRIKDRVMARAVAKYAAATVAEGVGLGQGGAVGLGLFLGGMALSTVTAATEEADRRSWTTLPGRVLVAELEVPAGDVELQLGTPHTAASGQPPRVLRGRVAAGETLFFAAREIQ